MPLSHDVALFIDVLALRCHDFRTQFAVCAGQANVIENNIQIPLANKVPRLLGCFNMPGEVRAAR